MGVFELKSINDVNVLDSEYLIIMRAKKGIPNLVVVHACN